MDKIHEKYIQLEKIVSNIEDSRKNILDKVVKYGHDQDTIEEHEYFANPLKLNEDYHKVLNETNTSPQEKVEYLFEEVKNTSKKVNEIYSSVDDLIPGTYSDAGEKAMEFYPEGKEPYDSVRFEELVSNGFEEKLTDYEKKEFKKIKTEKLAYEKKIDHIMEKRLEEMTPYLIKFDESRSELDSLESNVSRMLDSYNKE